VERRRAGLLPRQRLCGPAEAMQTLPAGKERALFKGGWSNLSREDLNEGDAVRVLHGMYAGEVGVVERVLRVDTTRGPYELIWVELPGRKVDAFKPERLEKVAATENS
jgi:hypothetical protein